MWCWHVRNQLSAYVDGELAVADARAVEEHLCRCERCAHERRSLQELTCFTAAVPEEDLPSGLHARIVTQLAYASAGPVGSVPFRPQPSLKLGPWGFALAAGAVALAAVVLQARTPERHANGINLADAARVQVRPLPPAEREERAERSAGSRRIAAFSIPHLPAPHRPEPVRTARADLARPSDLPAEKASPAKADAARPVPPPVRAERTLRIAGTGRTLRATRPQLAPATTITGVPVEEVRTVEPQVPMTLPQPEGTTMPGDPVVNSTVAVGGTDAMVVGMDKDATAVTRMAGGSVAMPDGQPEEDEGYRQLRMFLEERNRTIPQPPMLDPRDRRSRKSL